MSIHIPRLVISAVRGGAGKTLLTLGLTRAIVRLGHPVKPYKKGPDYIDTAWLEKAAGCPCTNLDPFFLDKGQLRSLVGHTWPPTPFTNIHGVNSAFPALALIEGNRGLFDGQDLTGSCSTAELARILRSPVLLSLDVTKMTRTAAAVLTGLASFEKDLHLAGVVLNQVGSSRHESVVRAAIEEYCSVPVLGALPRMKTNPLPEKHMGLATAARNQQEIVLDHLGQFISEHVDVSRVIALADMAQPLPHPLPLWDTAPRHLSPRPRIGYVRDDALWFYYHENLEALARSGADLLPLSLLDTKVWPQDLHGLYLGGGFPEDYADRIAASPHLESIAAFSHRNMPIYAECGGFMLLCASILRDGQHHAMSNLFPVHAQFLPRPQGLGYVTAAVTRPNPFHPVGTVLRGHEFHYSRCLTDASLEDYVTLRLLKGTGMGARSDGLCVRQTYASYTHIFAPACPWWADNFVNAASSFATT